MKKLLFLAFVLGAVTTSALAQPAQPSQSAQPAAQPQVDRASLLLKMQEQFKAPMVAKTGLSEAQVDKVLEINLDIRLAAVNELQGLSGEERTKKLADLKAEKEKRYAAIPLTDEQIRSVYAFYEEMGRGAEKRTN